MFAIFGIMLGVLAVWLVLNQRDKVEGYIPVRIKDENPYRRK